MTRRLLRVTWLAAVSWIAASLLCPSHAATSGVQAALEVTIEDAAVDFGEVSPALSPYTARDAVYISIRTWGTSPWNLTVQATGDFSVGGGGPTFPIGNLEVAARLNGEPAPFRRCSTSPVTLVSNGPVVGGIVAMDYRLNVGYDVPFVAPESGYSSELVYTTSYGLIAASFADPNPFNPHTDGTVRVKYYCVPTSASYLYFRIYNKAGWLVYSRSFSKPAEGWHEEAWDGKKADGSLAPDGVYSYYITTATYTMAAGFIQVAAAPAPAALRREDPARGPMTLELTARAEPVCASAGDIVTYYASVRNTNALAVENGRVRFTLPNGLRMLPGTDYLDGRPGLGSSTGAGASWELGCLTPGSAVNLSFKALIGPDAGPGVATGRARATGIVGGTTVSSRDVDVPIYVRDQIPAACGIVTGTVFIDESGDGKKDAGERPVMGAVLTLDTVEVARSGSDGDFVVDRLRPGDYALAVAASSLPRGYKPRSRVALISVAEGETVRLDVPLERAAREPEGKTPPVSLAGAGVLKLEASSAYTSCDARGVIVTSARGGPDLTLTAQLEPEPRAVGRLGLATQVGNSARLVAGLSRNTASDTGRPELDIRVEAAPAPNLTVAAGYEAARGVPWVSGEYERRLVEGLTLSVSLRLLQEASEVPGEGGGIDPGPRCVVLAPQASLAYSGASGVAGRLSYGDGSGGPIGEAACVLPLGPGLRLSVVHRWSGLAPSTTLVGLSYAGGANFALGAEYRPGYHGFQGTLRLAACISPDDPYRADLRASFEPGRENVSARFSLRFPAFRDAMATVAHDFESRQITGGTRAATSSTALAGSVRLGERVTASASWSTKCADEVSDGLSIRALTRGASIHLDRQVAPGLSLGLGVLWASQDPGEVSLVTADLRAACDVTPWARLVLGYRSALGAPGLLPAHALRATGPYARFLLAFGAEFPVPESRSIR